MQNEYERLIQSLEEALEKKLSELRKEEEEHKILHDKYENMYSRAKVESNRSWYFHSIDFEGNQNKEKSC